MKQQTLPGFEMFFKISTDREVYAKLLECHLELVAAIRFYPKLLPRAGIVGEKILNLLQATKSVLQTEIERE